MNIISICCIGADQMMPEAMVFDGRNITSPNEKVNQYFLGK